jgi:hypothetical protein
MTNNCDEYEYGFLWKATPTNEEFAETARNAGEWIAKARTLRVGAYVLRYEWLNARFRKEQGRDVPRTYHLCFPALFLASLALENLLKAVLLLREPALVENG